jgi:hypothetical protein
VLRQCIDKLVPKAEHRYNFGVLLERLPESKILELLPGVVPEIAPVPEAAVPKPLEIAACLAAEDRMANLQIRDAVGEKTVLAVPAIPHLDVSSAQLDLTLRPLAAGVR